MTTRVTRRSLGHQQATVRAMWAMYLLSLEQDKAYRADKAEGRANTRMNDLWSYPEDYARWYTEASEKLAHMRVA